MLIQTSSKECGDSEECADQTFHTQKGQEAGQRKLETLYKYCDTHGGEVVHGGVVDGAEESEDRDSDIEGLEHMDQQECHNHYRNKGERRLEYNSKQACEQQLAKTRGREIQLDDDDQHSADGHHHYHHRRNSTSSDEEGATSQPRNSTTLEDQSDPLSSSIPTSFSSTSSLSPSPRSSPFLPTSASGVMMVGGYGVLSLNRVYRDSSELKSAERKKLIFGSDQIKP